MKFSLVVYIFLVLTPVVFAEVTTLDYYSGPGIIFKENLITTVDDADIFFIGIEDKEEGLETPLLFADNLNAGIILKDKRDCYEIGLDEYRRDIEIEKNEEYCVLTKDGEINVEIMVLDYADDWSAVTIDWEVVEEKEEIDVLMSIFNIILVLLLIVIFVLIILLIKRMRK